MILTFSSQEGHRLVACAVTTEHPERVNGQNPSPWELQIEPKVLEDLTERWSGSVDLSLGPGRAIFSVRVIPLLRGPDERIIWKTVSGA